MTCSQSFALTLEDLELQGPKAPAYRVGLTDKPENPYVEAKQNIEKKEVKTNIENVAPEDMTYADLSIKKCRRRFPENSSLKKVI